MSIAAAKEYMDAGLFHLAKFIELNPDAVRTDLVDSFMENLNMCFKEINHKAYKCGRKKLFYTCYDRDDHELILACGTKEEVCEALGLATSTIEQYQAATKNWEQTKGTRRETRPPRVLVYANDVGRQKLEAC